MGLGAAAQAGMACDCPEAAARPATRMVPQRVDAVVLQVRVAGVRAHRVDEQAGRPRRPQRVLLALVRQVADPVASRGGEGRVADVPPEQRRGLRRPRGFDRRLWRRGAAAHFRHRRLLLLLYSCPPQAGQETLSLRPAS